eukprot:scaffold23310_cov75-Phaeocystis_antarctica.AAC.2
MERTERLSSNTFAAGSRSLTSVIKPVATPPESFRRSVLPGETLAARLISNWCACSGFGAPESVTSHSTTANVSTMGLISRSRYSSMSSSSLKYSGRSSAESRGPNRHHLKPFDGSGGVALRHDVLFRAGQGTTRGTAAAGGQRVAWVAASRGRWLGVGGGLAWAVAWRGCCGSSMSGAR